MIKKLKVLNNEYNLVEDWESPVSKPMRDGYGEAMMELGKRNTKVVVLVADLLESLRLEEFKRAYPQRLVELGIQEQNMMGVAAGMALSGKIPFVNSFACFSPGRNWEQLRISVCLTGNNVKVIGGHSGFGNGADGANQQSFEDIALTRVLPGMTVLAPVDYEQVKKAVGQMAELKGPIYMRMTKPAREVITTRITPFEIGRAQVFKEGGEVTVFACGSMVYEAIMAARELEGEVSVEVVNVHTIKPLDIETVVRSAKKTGRVITAEEHSIIGGLGGAIAETLGENYPVPIVRVGMRDLFGESGEPDELRQKYGLTRREIVREIKKMIAKK